MSAPGLACVAKGDGNCYKGRVHLACMPAQHLARISWFGVFGVLLSVVVAVDVLP